MSPKLSTRYPTDCQYQIKMPAFLQNRNVRFTLFLLPAYDSHLPIAYAAEYQGHPRQPQRWVPIYRALPNCSPKRFKLQFPENRTFPRIFMTSPVPYTLASGVALQQPVFHHQVDLLHVRQALAYNFQIQ